MTALELVLSKALPPREIAPPRSMVSSLAAEQKAQVPTVSNFSGRVTDVSAERRNASSPIARSEAGRVTPVRPAFWNALFAIAWTPSITVYVPPVFLAAGYRIRRVRSLEYRTPSTPSKFGLAGSTSTLVRAGSSLYPEVTESAATLGPSLMVVSAEL